MNRKTQKFHVYGAVCLMRAKQEYMNIGSSGYLLVMAVKFEKKQKLEDQIIQHKQLLKFVYRIVLISCYKQQEGDRKKMQIHNLCKPIIF